MTMSWINRLVRLLALCYLSVMCLYYFSLIYKGVSIGQYMSVLFWFQWGINLFGLIAIFNIFGKAIIMNINVWRVGFFFTLLMQGYSLVRHGLFIEDIDLQKNILILIQYLVLVIPSLSALLYLSLTKIKGSVSIK